MLSGASRDAGEVIHTVSHEMGHRWVAPLSGPSTLPAVTVVGHENVVALAREEGWWAALESSEASRAREEVWAEALARAWLGGAE
jgi:hypothetical protein